MVVRPVTMGQASLLGTTMGSPRDFAGLLAARRARLAWGPVIDSVRPLAEAAGAHAREEAGDHFGKLVLVDRVGLARRRSAARALAAARREVGRRAAAGRDDPSLSVEALAAALEADPADRAALAARRGWPAGRASSSRPGRPRRARPARAPRRRGPPRAPASCSSPGELVADGAGRVRLPGFGGSDLARDRAGCAPGPAGRSGRWRRPSRPSPAADLGPAAPAFLTGLRAGPAPGRGGPPAPRPRGGAPGRPQRPPRGARRPSPPRSTPATRTARACARRLRRPRGPHRRASTPRSSARGTGLRQAAAIPG